MLKKIFLSAAVAALVFTACDSDSSTSPKNDDKSVEDPAKEPDSAAVNGKSETTVYDTVKTSFSADQDVVGDECLVRKTSADSFVMTMSEAGVTTSITSVLKGDKVKLTYVSVYDESIPMATIQSFCDANKQEAVGVDASVECDGRTMTVRETKESDMTFEQMLASAKSTCEKLNSSVSSNAEEPDSGIEPNQGSLNENAEVVTDPTRATCQITEKTTNTLKMVMAQPDSGSIYTSYEYKNGTLVTEARFDFLMTMPLTQINEYCADLKADAAEMAEEDGSVVDVDCDGYRITVTVVEQSSMNVLPYIASDMVEYCNEIQRTGVIPEDDDEEDTFF
ncbi:MAG: hypothetical protein IK114_10585 [Fibrobacter sp.]|nr:hypothetical protein [Fibrobacter sp.]